MNTSPFAQTISAPKSYLKPLKIVDKLLMLPGPTNLHPRVSQALSTPIISHVDPRFYKLLAEIQDGIRYLMQTNSRWCFALTGTGTCAMETVICNMLLPKQRLLSLVHGHWGERAAMMADRLGIDAVRVHTSSFGKIFSLQQIEDALQKYRPNLMYVCHGDSSVGILQPLDGIGQLCRRYNCLLMVDAVVSLCSAPLDMDRLEIDVVYSGAQKALSGPPGIALIALGDNAVRTLKARLDIQPVISFYMDLALVAKAWGVENEGKYAYHYTHAINLLYGLREAIALVVEESLQNVIERHQKIKLKFETMLDRMKLECPIVRSEHRLPGIMAVSIPDDIDGACVIKHLYEKYNISIGGSLLVSSNSAIPKFWRMGYLGINANSKAINKLCFALAQVLSEQRCLKSKL